MTGNRKKFELYVFLSTFSRNLIEVFIPVILYKYGYELKEVVLYFLLTNAFSLVLSYPLIKLSKKFNNKILTLIGIVSFVIVQIMLAYIVNSIWYIISLAFIYAMYRRGYWISRRYYNLNVMEKEKIGTTFSIISIVNNLGVILASYIGAVMLDYLDVIAVTIISIVIFLFSIIPLSFMKFKHEKDEIRFEVVKTLKEIPFRNLYLFGSYELLNVVKFMFALYIFIYVKDTYTTVGFFTLITNLSVLVFSYLYGKKIDESKNLLKLSIVLVVLTYILKANSTYIVLAIVSFLEGIFTKMHEISISKEFYALSKKFEYNNYNLVYELIQNGFRTFSLLVIYLLNIDLKISIYWLLLIMFLGAFMNFKQIDKRDYKPVEK